MLTEILLWALKETLRMPVAAGHVNTDNDGQGVSESVPTRYSSSFAFNALPRFKFQICLH